jgi:hypothetical protein
MAGPLGSADARGVQACVKGNGVCNDTESFSGTCGVPGGPEVLLVSLGGMLHRACNGLPN